MQDRLDADARGRFESWVEAVRVGTIFAHDNRQYGRWKAKARNARPGARGLTGEALEAAVMHWAAMFPDNVIVGGPA